jgi:hypothetical protein
MFRISRPSPVRVTMLARPLPRQASLLRRMSNTPRPDPTQTPEPGTKPIAPPEPAVQPLHQPVREQPLHSPSKRYPTNPSPSPDTLPGNR